MGSSLRTTSTTENIEHQAFAAWVQWNQESRPELKLLYHIPNGEKRDPKVGRKLSRMLVRPGVPDFHLPVPVGEYKGLWIELKSLKGVVSPIQKLWLDRLANHGHACVIAYGAEKAKEAVILYLENKLPK